MSNLLKKFSIDKNAAESGKWFQLDDEVSICVRRLNSDFAVKARAKIETEFEKHRLYPSKNFPQHINEEISRRLIAEAVLVDWKGVKDDDGSAMPYTIEQGLDTIRKSDDFWLLVVTIAMDMSNFRTDLEKKTLGNSSNT